MLRDNFVYVVGGLIVVCGILSAVAFDPYDPGVGRVALYAIFGVAVGYLAYGHYSIMAHRRCASVWLVTITIMLTVFTATLGGISAILLLRAMASEGHYYAALFRATYFLVGSLAGASVIAAAVFGVARAKGRLTDDVAVPRWMRRR